ncbi:hypothetical protein OS493_024494 [Desmophyllum pertusum]|uniref:Uncharacterized protein n=1 Tax=Desmophyllum pertusum TaxID=174260 RepID=A0A9W9YDJ5_9CNID|nr:hypothetical protein OS493_024494 [Desmophyllum pertusum]
MLDNYLEGDEQDVVRKVDIWNHFEEENAVSADCKNQFFSYLGQYVFCAEPFRRVTVEIKKKKRHGYSFLRRMPIVTEIADAALSHRIIYNVDDMHSDVEEKKLDSTICATVSSTNQEPSSSAGTETHYPKRDCVTDHLVDQEASNEGPMELSDEEFTSDEHSDSLEDEELEDEEIECETVRKSEEPLSSTIDGLEDAAKRFYLKHYKSIKKLLPSQLPGSHKTFGGFLQEIFPNDVEVTGGPVEAAGKSTVYKISQMRAFLAVAFPPLVVGSLAIEHVQSAEKGKHFPQFSHVSGSTIKCEICLPHQKWATVNLKTCHKLKSKHVTVQSILDGTAILNFSGVVQAEEHNRSKCHQDALLFFTEEKQTMELKATFQEKKELDAGKITCFKTLPGHESCHEYKTWKKSHPIDASGITRKSHSSSRSVYVPLTRVIAVYGKEVHVKGGIKSLDPPCLEDAISFGDHPYTCANCANQLRQLKDILRHREVGSCNSLANRIGHVGFNKRYARKGEFSEALNKEVDRRKGAVKQVSALLQVKLSSLEWENQLQESCRYGDDQKLIMDLARLFKSGVSKTQPLQVLVIKNLVSKLLKANNHHYLDIIKDISSLFKNQLGPANYAILSEIFGLARETTAAEHAAVMRLDPGINNGALASAVSLFKNLPVNEASDGARSLRYLQPFMTTAGEVVLLGQSWNPDVNRWAEDVLPIPRRNIARGDVDDFGALKRTIDDDYNKLNVSFADKRPDECMDIEDQILEGVDDDECVKSKDLPTQDEDEILGKDEMKEDVVQSNDYRKGGKRIFRKEEKTGLEQRVSFRLNLKAVSKQKRQSRTSTSGSDSDVISSSLKKARVLKESSDEEGEKQQVPNVIVEDELCDERIISDSTNDGTLLWSINNDTVIHDLLGRDDNFQTPRRFLAQSFPIPVDSSLTDHNIVSTSDLVISDPLKMSCLPPLTAVEEAEKILREQRARKQNSPGCCICKVWYVQRRRSTSAQKISQIKRT